MKRPRIAMLLWAPLMGLQAPSSFAQSLFDCPPTGVMIHNIESTEGLRNRTTITIVVPKDAGNALGAVVCGSCPILIGGIRAIWNLGLISATIPFVAKKQEDWPQLTSQALKRI